LDKLFEEIKILVYYGEVPIADLMEWQLDGAKWQPLYM
jgi:hypothetical protein